MSCNWDEYNLNRVTSINWRASLVPAAAVIPAPIAYIKIVAVKTLVVGYLLRTAGLPQWSAHGLFSALSWGECLHFTVWHMIQNFYFEEMRVFQAGACREYVSRE